MNNLVVVTSDSLKELIDAAITKAIAPLVDQLEDLKIRDDETAKISMLKDWLPRQANKTIAAKILGINRKTVDSWIAKGKLSVNSSKKITRQALIECLTKYLPERIEALILANAENETTLIIPEQKTDSAIA